MGLDLEASCTGWKPMRCSGKLESIKSESSNARRGVTHSKMPEMWRGSNADECMRSWGGRR